LITFILIGVYCLWALGRPLAPIEPVKSSLKLESMTVSNQLAWPSKGQAAVGTNPSGVLATFGEQKPVPTASVAKVFTALMVLKKRPIKLGETGPIINITEADVQSYRDYLAGDGSVIPVQVGEDLTQYQMLQAIMLPSANNVADSLAIWAFGSLENYTKFANDYIRQLGLTNTVIGSDASGYDASTVSTAHDLVLLGEAAMQEPVIAEIVGQPSAVLPVAGSVQNRNFLLGPDGLAGIKTGTTVAAGGVFLAAKQVTINGMPLTLVSAIVGAENTFNAQVESVPLLKSVQNNFAETKVLSKGSVVGHYKSQWGDTVTAVTTKPLSTLAWKGSMVPTNVEIDATSATAESGQVVGSVQVPRSPVSIAHKVPVALTGSFSQPSLAWRLTHPL
jgi:D-alanyl-D-alanine carboxypeptidase (penicillin-binding protein 5/6)